MSGTLGTLGTLGGGQVGGAQAVGGLDGQADRHDPGRRGQAEAAQATAFGAGVGGGRLRGGSLVGPSGPVRRAGRGDGFGGQVARLAQVEAGLEPSPRAEPGGGGGPGVPVSGGLAMGGGQPRGLARLGQAAVQFAGRPARHGQFTAGAWRQKPGSLAFGDVGRACGQDAGRDRRAEHGRADEQVLGPVAEPVEQLAKQLLPRDQGDDLGGGLGQLGRLGLGRRPAGPGLDRRGDALGQVVEAQARREERVQVLQGARVASGQPPGQVALGFGDEPERGQGQRELGRPGASQRPEVTKHEPVAVSRGHGEGGAAGDQELPGPAGQHGGERGIADGPQARLAGQVVVEVVQDDQVGLGWLAGQAGRGDLAADQGHGPLGGQPAHSRRDLRGEGRLADSAQAVHHDRGHVRAGQVRGPAPSFGGPDRQGGVLGGGGTGGSGVTGGVLGPGWSSVQVYFE